MHLRSGSNQIIGDVHVGGVGLEEEPNGRNQNLDMPTYAKLKRSRASMKSQITMKCRQLASELGNQTKRRNIRRSAMQLQDYLKRLEMISQDMITVAETDEEAAEVGEYLETINKEADLLLRQMEEELEERADEVSSEPSRTSLGFSRISLLDEQPEKTTRVKTNATRPMVQKPPCREEDWLERMLRTGSSQAHGISNQHKSSIKTELPKFHGDLLEWRNFKSMFEALVQKTNKSPAEKLTILKSAMGTEPGRLIKNITGGEQAYIKAMELLHRRYGDPIEHRRVQREMLRALEPVASGDHASLQAFADEVQGLLSALVQDGTESVDLTMELAEKLPFHEHSSWNLYARQLPNGPGLEAFSDWLADLAQSTRRLKNVLPIKLQKEAASERKASKNFVAKTQDNVQCEGCGKQYHTIGSCFQYKKMTVEDRVKLVKSKGLCFKCLGRSHRIDKCPEPDRKCSEDGCSKTHHPTLHGGFGMDQKQVKNHSAAGNHDKIGFGLIWAEVKGTSGRWIKAEVMLDNGSDTTLVSDEFCKKAGLKKWNKQMVTVNGAGGSKSEMQTAQVRMIFKTCDGLMEANGYSIKTVTKPLGQVNWAEAKYKYPHLADLPLKNHPGRPDILLGIDNIDFHKGLEVRSGKNKEPYAERTVLGWIPRGTAEPSRDQVCRINHCALVEQKEDIEKFFDGENFGTEFSYNKVQSQQKETVFRQIQENVKEHSDGGYEVSLPWKSSPDALKNNLYVAQKRLDNIVQRFDADGKYFDDYDKTRSHYLDEEYAEVVCTYDPNEKQMPDDPKLDNDQYFLYHHGVLNVADEATCCDMIAEVITERWKHGTSFLYKAPEEWPKDLKSTEIDLKKKQKWNFTSGQVQVKRKQSSIACFGSFQKAVRVIAWGVLFIRRLVWKVTERTVLDLIRNTKDDTQQIKLPRAEETFMVSKRNLMAKLTQVFSPLGLIAPFIIKGKIRLARLHLLGLVWDQDPEKQAQNAETNEVSVKQGEVAWWKAWLSKQKDVEEEKFQRCLQPDPQNIVTTELHSFMDASVTVSDAFRTRMGDPCQWVDEELSAAQRHQASGFGIPLVPADQHADLAVFGIPDGPVAVAGGEVELLFKTGVLRDVGLAIAAEKRAVGIMNHGGIVVEAGSAGFEERGDEDDAQFLGQFAETIRDRAGNGVCEVEEGRVFDGAEVGRLEELLGDHDVGPVRGRLTNQRFVMIHRLRLVGEGGGLK